MATQRFTFRPESYPQTATALAHTASDYELASVRELASSQPVSLIQLCTKAGHSRNRAARRARVSHSDSADGMTETLGVSSLHGVEKEGTFSRPPLPNYANTAEYGLSDEPRHPNPPSRIVSQEYAENAQEQTWHPSLNDYHTQKNPLNYASHCNDSQSRESSYMSESPFLRKSDLWNLSRSERATEPADMTPVTNQSPMDMPQSNLYTQKAHQKEYMSASSLQLYRDSFDRPHDKSPYESFRLKHRNNRTDLPEITSGLQYGFPSNLDHGNSIGNTNIQSEPSLATHICERLSNSEAVAHSRGAQKSHLSQDASTLGSSLSNGTNISQRTLKEEIYAILDNMNIGSKTDPKSTRNSKAMEYGSTGVQDEAQPAQPLRAGTSPLYGEISGNAEIVRGGSKSHGLDSGERPARRQQEVNATDNLYMVETGQSNIELSMQAERGLRRTSGTSDMPPARIIRPPPGLSEPDIPSRFKKAEARLRDADNWFHQDARGEGQLRRYIASVAENFVDRSERLGGQAFSGKDRVFAKQTISVLGDAIANIHSYGPSSRKEQGQYFADFKPVASRYCESREQRSYFDNTWGRCREATPLDRDSEYK
ncbi:hypothetical protein BJX76DRAFT_150158 [Aspergillus varians]